MDSTKRICPKCSQPRDLDDFLINPATGRRNYACRMCKEVRLQSKVWDWACALQKATRMRVAWQKGKTGQYIDTLNEDMLRALMEAQEQRCVLSRMALRLPTPDELQILSKNKNGYNITLTAWAETLSEADRRRVPVLVRVDSLTDWMPGNVILICAFLEDFYTRCGSLPAFRNYCNELIESSKLIQPPTKEDLLAIISRMGRNLQP